MVMMIMMMVVAMMTVILITMMDNCKEGMNFPEVYFNLKRKYWNPHKSHAVAMHPDKRTRAEDHERSQRGILKLDLSR